MDLVSLVLNLNTPCKTCKYFKTFCDKQESCLVCEHCNENGMCHCVELVPIEETTCPSFKEKDAEE